ncbi:MAG: hypothetical protein AAGD13_13925 [Pseudomonadota bacterium]
MTGIIFLDIAIGVIFLILVFSLFASAVQEAISAIFNLRAKSLRRGIYGMIGNADEFKAFWQSPLIESLKGPMNVFEKKIVSTEMAKKGDDTNKRAPSDVPTDVFTKTVLHQVRNQIDELRTKLDEEARELKDKLKEIAPSDIPGLVEQIHIVAASDRSPELVKRVSILLHGVETKTEHIEAAIDSWYDNARDRFAGWYIRRMQFWLFFIGLFLAVLTNTDPIRYAVELHRNDQLRQDVVQKATEISALEELEDVMEALVPVEDRPKGDTTNLEAIQKRVLTEVGNLQSELGKIKADTGWDHCKEARYATDTYGFECFFDTIEPISEDRPIARNPLLGWLLLALAVMLGAQFWLDMLKRFVSIRSSVVTPSNEANKSKGGQNTS